MDSRYLYLRNSTHEYSIRYSLVGYTKYWKYYNKNISDFYIPQPCISKTDNFLS